VVAPFESLDMAVEMVSKAVLGEAASWKVFFAQKWTDLYRKPTMST